MRCTVLHLSRLDYASAESEAETPNLSASESAIGKFYHMHVRTGVSKRYALKTRADLQASSSLPSNLAKMPPQSSRVLIPFGAIIGQSVLVRTVTLS